MAPQTNLKRSRRDDFPGSGFQPSIPGGRHRPNVEMAVVRARVRSQTRKREKYPHGSRDQSSGPARECGQKRLILAAHKYLRKRYQHRERTCAVNASDTARESEVREVLMRQLKDSGAGSAGSAAASMEVARPFQKTINPALSGLEKPRFCRAAAPKVKTLAYRGAESAGARFPIRGCRLLDECPARVRVSRKTNREFSRVRRSRTPTGAGGKITGPKPAGPYQRRKPCRHSGSLSELTGESPRRLARKTDGIPGVRQANKTVTSTGRRTAIDPSPSTILLGEPGSLRRHKSHAQRDSPALDDQAEAFGDYRRSHRRGIRPPSTNHNSARA